jgi:hypothetical protein
MGTATAIDLDFLRRKITSWLVKERPLAKSSEVIVVAQPQVLLRVAASSNHSFQGTAGKLRLPVRSGLRPPPAPELER